MEAITSNSKYLLTATDKTFSINGDTYAKNAIPQIRYNESVGTVSIMPSFCGRQYYGKFDEYGTASGTFTSLAALRTYIEDNFFFDVGSSGGNNGESPELQFAGAVLQWKLPSEPNWKNLYDFSNVLWLKGKEYERLAIVSPATGTLFYQLDKAIGLYEYKKSAWHFVGERLLKTIPATNYTLLSEDRGYVLEFENACIVTVPNNVFAQGIEIPMIQKGASLSVIAGSGLAIQKPTIYSNAAMGTYATIFAVFESASSCILKGELNLA